MSNKTNKTKTVAIILAAGKGERFDEELPKQFAKLAGRSVIEHTISVFEKHKLIDEIYIVVNKDYFLTTKNIIQRALFKKVTKILRGAETRQGSSRIGVLACDNKVEKILIHDSVRPFVDGNIITNIIEYLNKFSAVDVGIAPVDTIVEISDYKIKKIPKRNSLLRGQTPQGFRGPVIKKAHEMALNDGYVDFTDDCSLILNYNLGEIYVLKGSEYNIKITHPIDIHLADKIFQIHKINLDGISLDAIKEGVNGKIIVIFGGTSGIGLEICKMVEKFGGKAMVFSRRNGTDINNFDSIKNALNSVYESYHKIDSVICTVGALKIGFIETIEVEDIVDQINTNLVSSMLVAKASIPYLKQTNGNLLFFASSSYTMGRSGYTPYSASKAGLVNFAQGLSDELSIYNIRVNIINPERTDTPMRRDNFGEEDKSSLLSPEFVALNSLKTLVSNVNGSVIEIRRIDEEKIKFTNQTLY